MFTIILQNESGDEIERLFLKDSDAFLLQDDEVNFPSLSELSSSSYDVFGSSDMRQLLIELETLTNEASNSAHFDSIRKITQLAKACCKSSNYRLLLTPFSK